MLVWEKLRERVWHSIVKRPNRKSSIWSLSLKRQIRLHLQGLPVGRVTITKQFPQAVSIHGREGEILQVLSNLFLNALDVLPEQDAKFRLRIRIVGKRVHMAIADNGQGIPTALRASLFKPDATGKSKGTGVGLWLSRQIMDRHSGTIRFRSSRRVGDSGTVFLLTIPVAQVHDR